MSVAVANHSCSSVRGPYEQLRMLSHKLAGPRPQLLYVTCSLLHSENGAVVNDFVSEEHDAHHVDVADPPAGRWERLGRGDRGVTFYPGARHQGGYAALLCKQQAS